jgi:hypothetical protein
MQDLDLEVGFVGASRGANSEQSFKSLRQLRHCDLRRPRYIPSISSVRLVKGHVLRSRVKLSRQRLSYVQSPRDSVPLAVVD